MIRNYEIANIKYGLVKRRLMYREPINFFKMVVNRLFGV